MARIFALSFPTVRPSHCHPPTAINTRFYGTIAARKGGVTDLEKVVRRHSETVTEVKENAEIFVSGQALRARRLAFYQKAQEYAKEKSGAGILTGKRTNARISSTKDVWETRTGSQMKKHAGVNVVLYLHNQLRGKVLA